jgi:hypothetical protein
VLDLIELAPPVPYRLALEEICGPTLLVMQASNCNAQIPAKLYEYFRAGRPILALTDPAGDTAQAVREAGSTAIARLDLASEIADLLRKFVQGTLPRTACTASAVAVTRASRRARTADLARLMGEVVARYRR